MDLIDNNIDLKEINLKEIKKKLPQPNILDDSLDVLKQQFHPVLDDFQKYYIFHHKNPEYNEYTQMFSQMKGNLQKIQSTLFMKTNDIETLIQEINKHIIKLDIRIKKEKERNQTLKKKLGIVESTNNSAEEMIDDYKNMYHLQYSLNFLMGIVILISGVITFQVFRKIKIIQH